MNRPRDHRWSRPRAARFGVLVAAGAAAVAWSMPELYGSAGQAPAPATAPAPQRFAPLSVQAQASAGSAPAEEETDAAARLLLPAGFSTESPMQALAVDGT